MRVEFKSELTFENVLHVHRGVCCRLRVLQYDSVCCSMLQRNNEQFSYSQIYDVNQYY